jgi:hypothetical protein
MISNGPIRIELINGSTPKNPCPSAAPDIPIPRKIPNSEIAKISSNDAAAMTIDDTPFVTPYPKFRNRIQLGTTTAGLTAPIINPQAKQSPHGMSNINRIKIAAADASNIWGIAVSRRTAVLFDFN